MRPSLVIQHICFASLAFCPWAIVLGVNVWVVVGAAVAWSAGGLASALWHRRIEEA